MVPWKYFLLVMSFYEITVVKVSLYTSSAFLFFPLRRKYTTFRSKCWRHVTKKCYSDEACLETLIKDDMPCSANADCKAAYISSWGTMLHMECTCQNLPPVEQPLCELFHHMLHSKSCFSDLRE